jgi:hypothetical protein
VGILLCINKEGNREKIKKMRLKLKTTKMSKKRTKNKYSKTAQYQMPKKLKNSNFKLKKNPYMMSDHEIWNRIDSYNQLDLYNFMKSVENCKIN